MDERIDNISESTATGEGCITETRDENLSPTSGSSSDAYAEETGGRVRRSRKHSRSLRAKRKRKWKPYNELTWDERRVQDDRESRRANAKRERLSAEGHPIAPYNTTQFLMDDRSPSRKKIVVGNNNSNSKKTTLDEKNEESITTTTRDSSHQQLVNNTGETKDVYSSRRLVVSDSCKSLSELDETNVVAFDASKVLGEKLLTIQARMREGSATNSPTTPVLEISASAEKNTTADSQDGSDFQSYIMNDFSHMYADIHAEQLQAMSKADLVGECLKLERRVDSLERRVKDCRRKHKYDYKGRTDVHLLEKINQLQALNAQLLKDNAALVSSEEQKQVESTLPESNHGAPTTVNN